MLEWLLAPMDATRVHEVGWHLSWHARIMVLAWGILVPLGIIVARYCKISPKQNWPEQLDNRLWWNTHQFCQYSACALTGVGAWFILNAPPLAGGGGIHWYLGWTTLALACVQIAGGVLRGSKGGPTDSAKSESVRGDHFDMTTRRLVFEFVHKGAGYIVLGLSCLTISSGLWQANAPKWMLAVIVLWWITLMVISVILQRKGLAFDTYQAIWGPDPSLPGNKRKPIGIGISRKK
ncbi:hypothetical protein BCF46_1074 [Litoreibacter meonggei]|uniref:Cytochrome b561 domain-containing protein n=1 Tax=Litoreibacter meonggei TaxID=1049199 RepID=A0A497X1B3_9RHOB|nr:cytochrome b561 domain-containing protein [Litoreibacter meonggei]RLJ58936.1 hypothetical protein BCF46_1074 [Litoreibacter meonggei]